MSTTALAPRRQFLLCFAAVLLSLMLSTQAFAQFRVAPYVQNPASDSMTIVWFSEAHAPGALTCYEGDTTTPAFTAHSGPVLVPALAYTTWETKTFFNGAAPPPPFRHEIRVGKLKPDTRYRYEVTQGNDSFAAHFRTAPAAARAVRFIAYGDCETEPESTGAKVDWSDPNAPDSRRLYLVDQTDGYAANLAVIKERRPDFIVIAGDIAESGGEQRDWDEFWKHNAAKNGATSVAGNIPIMPAIGNHDYYAGPKNGGYKQPFSEAAVAKCLTYFRVPPNGAGNKKHESRYYRLEYGPVALIVLDLNNGEPDDSDRDTNHHIAAAGSNAPDFYPGTPQYEWLEQQLKDAQRTAKFTFVAFHHCPYSSGPHGLPPGSGDDSLDAISGIPVRVLTPLFMKYGVDALLNGHDEMFERSEVTGTEQLPNGTMRPHTLQVYDVGVGGDGLRGPTPGVENPLQKFLAHKNSPEIWKGNHLVDGGKHYGHLEVDVTEENGKWITTLSPVYVFPVMDEQNKTPLRFERRVYPDVIKLQSDR
jgi:3',5'-cyclic AMP phosphodiesterase CpdA